MERRTFLNLTSSAIGSTAFPSFISNYYATIMNQRPHSFNFGDFKCTVFHDLDFVYQAEHYFINAAEDVREKSLKKYNQIPDKIPSPFISLLLEREDQRVLIDTGLGFMEEPVDFHGQPIKFKGQLQHQLRSHDVDPDTITHVVMTHFHPDHIGGVCDDQKQLHFPKAKHIAHREEWDYWTGETAASQPPLFGYFIDQNIRPLHDKNLQLLTGAEAEILPDITFIQVPGHTPGQFALHVASQGKDLLFISDVWLHPLHIEHLEWQTSYDLDHDLAMKSRIRMLELAYRNNMLVQSFHFPFPGLGHIDKTKDDWQWVEE